MYHSNSQFKALDHDTKPSDVILSKDFLSYANKLQDDKPEELGVDLSVLTKGLGQPFESTDFGLILKDTILSDVQNSAHPITGYWVGTLFLSNAPGSGTPKWAFYICIDTVVNNSLSGNMIDATHSKPTISITGSFLGQDHRKGITEAKFMTHFPAPSSSNYVFFGEYDYQRDIIKGHWSMTKSDSDEATNQIDNSNARFQLTRSPPHAFRFLDLLHQPFENTKETSPNLARRRWAFALQAVIYQVQERRKSWEFISARIAERNTWMELYVKTFVRLPDYPIVVSEESQKLLERLLVKIHPINRLIYDSAAIYLFHRQWFSIS